MPPKSFFDNEESAKQESGKINLRKLIDIPMLQELTDELYLATGIPSALITINGEILTGSGWQRICTDFHRRHPEIEKECIKSDIEIRKKLDAGDPFVIYKCPRGLIDSSVPLIIDGEYVANVFTGQLFLEEPDEKTEQFFRETARKYGLDEGEYIKAFKEIPVISEERFKNALAYLTKMTKMLVEIGKSRIAEKKTHDKIKAEGRKFKRLLESTRSVPWELDLETQTFTYFGPQSMEVLGYPVEHWINMDSWAESIHPDDRRKALEFCNSETLAGRDHEFQYRMVKPDGSMIWIEDVVSVISEAGQPKRLAGFMRDITESKLAEEALRSSKKRLQEAQKVAHIGNWEWNLEKQSLMWSDEVFRIFGVMPNAFAPSAEAFEATIHPDDKEDFLQQRAQMLEEKQSACIDHRIILPSGEVRYVQEMTQLLSDENGQVSRVIGTVQDITERKRAEEALKQSEEKYRTYVENSPLGIFIANAEARYIDVNQAACRMLGYTRQELLKLSIPEIASPDLPPEDLESFAELKQSGKIDIETRLRRKDGSDIHIALSAVKLSDDRFMAFCSDITQRKLAEKALQESKETAERYLNIAAEIIISLDTAGNITLLNESGHRLLGYKSGELIGKNWFTTCLPNNIVKDVSIVFDKIMHGEITEVENYENQVITKDGSTKTILWHNSILNDKKGNVTGLLSSGEDITERKQVEEALKESEYRLSSHLQNTPVAVIEWNLDFEVVEWNAAAERIFGYTREEALGRHAAGLIVPESAREHVNGVWSDLLANKGGFHSINENLTRDGQVIICDWNNTPLVDEYGNVFGVASLVQNITERKRIEKALQGSEERLTQMIEHMGTGVAVYEVVDQGNDFIFKTFNASAERITKISREKAIGNRLLKLFPKMDESGLLGALQRTWKTGKAEHLPPFYYKDKDREGWRENRIYKLPSGEVVALFDDVTDRMQSEEALRESLERFRGFDQHSTEGVYRIEITKPVPINLPRTEIVKWINEYAIVGEANDALAQMYGLEPDDMIGKPAIEFAPDYGERAAKVLEKEGYRIINEETKDVDKDGNTLYLLENYHGIVEDGLLTAVWGAQNDITDRKKAEEEIRKLSSIVENSRDFIGIASLEGKVLYLNQAGCEMVGLKGLEEAQTKTIFDFVPADASENMRNKYVPEVFEKGFSSGEGKLKTFDSDRVIDISFSLFTIKEPGKKKPSYLSIIIKDISEQKQLREQLMQASKMESIGQLAGGIAHDFNNLLTTIIGNCSLILSDLDEKEELYEEVKDILTSGMRAADLTRQLLAFSRKQVLEPQVVDPNYLITNLQKMLIRLIGEDIEFILDCKGGIGNIKVDPGQFEQVLVNLTINARDAMLGGGKLVISTSQIASDAPELAKMPEVAKGDYVRISVTDTGFGMTKDIMDRIFDPFYTTKEINQGTGLGLSTVYGVVKQSKGYILANSKVGRGSEFIVVFPVVKEKTSSIKQDTIDIDDSEATGTILLVEDDVDVRRITSRILDRKGYRVIEAETGREALTILKDLKCPVDILVTDVIMPKMSGVELTGRVKQQYPDLKTLYISGYTPDVIANKGLLEDGTPYLKKPFDPMKLLSTIEEILRKGERGDLSIR